jgi:CheY-like chemotaxis protein
MRLLMVEDNEYLAEITAQLLHSLDRRTRRLESITIAGDLETAIHFLPEHDAVLCDGRFPISPNSRFIAEEWDVVRHEADRRGIRFVLYSGCVRALLSAREAETLALAKPAPIEEIYAAITCPKDGVRTPQSGDDSLEMDEGLFARRSVLGGAEPSYRQAAIGDQSRLNSER